MRHFGIAVSLAFLLIGLQAPVHQAMAADEAALNGASGLTMYVFMSETCPHCRAQKPFLAALDASHERLDIRHMEVMTTREHHELLRNMAALHDVQPGSVPMIFVGGKVWVGDSRELRREISDHVEACLSASGCPF